MGKFTGVYTAIITPFCDDETVNFSQLAKLVERQIGFGNNIFCNGTNGEFYATTFSEKVDITTQCVEAVSGRAKVIAHVGCASTRESILLGKEMQRLGVEAVSAITPYFIPCTQSEIERHYATIADALEVPLFLYTIPARTGNTLEKATVHKLSEHPNIVGIKDSTGTQESLDGYLELAKECNIEVMTGPDSLILHGFQNGASGCVSGLANVLGQEVNDIWRNFSQGNVQLACAAQDKVTVMRQSLYSLGFPPDMVKEAMYALNTENGLSRSPKGQLRDLNETVRDLLKN
jgi:4-hydroxy-tetrahydrodipicolinate synthase